MRYNKACRKAFLGDEAEIITNDPEYNRIPGTQSTTVNVHEVAMPPRLLINRASSLYQGMP